MKALLYVLLIGGLIALGYAAFEWTRGGAVFPKAGLQGAATGEFAELEIQRPPRPMPDIPFALPDGTVKSLADYRGKTLLVNLWATWCAPCIKELPTLEALQEEMGSQAFQVLAISLDAKGPDHAAAFLEDLGIEALAPYTDAEMRFFKEGRIASGLPTTLLIDPEGRELARFVGDADWNSPEAHALIRAALPEKTAES